MSLTRYFCHLSCPVHGALLEQTQETNSRSFGGRKWNLEKRRGEKSHCRIRRWEKSRTVRGKGMTAGPRSGKEGGWTEAESRPGDLSLPFSMFDCRLCPMEGGWILHTIRHLFQLWCVCGQSNCIFYTYSRKSILPSVLEHLFWGGVCFILCYTRKNICYFLNVHSELGYQPNSLLPKNVISVH